MKKLFLLAPALCLTVALMTTGDDASAQLQAQPAPGIVRVNPAILKLLAPNVHGTVDMTAARNGEYGNMDCGKLSVSATSVATVPCAPGGIFCVPTPKWTHTEAALTATANPGICGYSIAVPTNQAFGLSVSTQVNLCLGSGLTYVNLKQTASTGSLTVPHNGTKDADLVITSFQKACIN